MHTQKKDPAFEFVKRLGEEITHQEFDLPPFPDVAIRVRDALNDYDVTINKITQIVLLEPVLTTRILRMANSAMLRRSPIEITDLKAAITKLGLKMVRNAAVSLAMDQTFHTSEGSVLRNHIEGIRKHSIDVCALAYVLAKRQPGIKNSDEVMLAGLLHDIGKFYILTRVGAFPDLFNDKETLDALLMEWHTGVGRAIVESWGFPEQIAEVIGEHETLDWDNPGSVDMVDIVIVANLLAHLGEPEYPDVHAVSQTPSCRRMSLDDAAIQEILEESGEEIRSMAQALK